MIKNSFETRLCVPPPEYYMNRRFPLFLLLSALIVGGCSDQPTEASIEDIPRELLAPTLSIVDALNGGNPGFFWNDPIGDGGSTGAPADPTLFPRVEICERETIGDSCRSGPLLATFYRDQGANRDRIDVDGSGEYSVRWRLNRFSPDRGGIYRIRVLIGTEELGHADIIAIRHPLLRAFIRRITDELIPISDRGQFEIGFRIEEGALEGQLCDFDGDGDIQDCDAGVERPGDGQSTRVQVTGMVGGQPVVAAVITAPDGVFTDINGTPIPDVILTAELELTPPSDDVFPDALELPFFVEVNTFPNDVYIDPNGPGVNVVICQDSPALLAKNVTEPLHPQLILYKVSDGGVTRRLQSTFGAPECDGYTPPPGAPGIASLLQRGARSLLSALGPQPVRARRLHGGLNTVIRRDVSIEAPFSTFGAALGPNAAQSTAVVPPTVTEGQTVVMMVQTRTALGDNFLFGGDVVDVQVTSGANAGATVMVVDNLDGTYSASYLAALPGVDQVDIILDRMDYIVPGPIGGSPFSVTVTPLVAPGVADPSSSVATVPGGAPNFVHNVWVQLFDGLQAPLSTGGDVVQATVSGANSAAGNVVDNGDGTYLVSYTPSSAGIDQIDITVNGLPIAGSPFASTVYAPVTWSSNVGGNDHVYQYRPILRLQPFNQWTVAEAEANAATMGPLVGHLLVVDDQAEQTFLAGAVLNALGGATGWIGFDDADADGTYTWATGQVLATGVTGPTVPGTCVAAFCDFSPNEPNRNGGVEFYGEITSGGGGWNDLPNSAGTRVGASIIEFEPATGSLTVTVTDGGAPLQGVTVSLAATNFAAITNGNGVATFTGIPATSYTVNASLVGYTFGSAGATVPTFGTTTAALTGAPAAGVISSTQPTSGTMAHGQLITVFGSGFPVGATVQFTQGATTAPATYTWLSAPTAFVVRSPSAGFVPGPVDITVTSNQGTSAPVTYTFTTVPSAPVILEPASGADVPLGTEVLVGGHGIDTSSARYDIELIQTGDTISIKGSISTGGNSGLPANRSMMPAAGGAFVPGAATIRMRVGDGFLVPYGPWSSVTVNIVP